MRNLVFLLLVLLPSQLGYHFWPDWSLINGIRVDYLSPTLYLTDLIILALFGLSRLRARIPLTIIVFAVLNISISISPLLSLYKWVRVYEYFWLYKYLVNFQFSIFNFQFLRKWLGLAVIWAVVLATWQLAIQKSVGGLWYWLGERSFSLTTPGIAKIFLRFGNWDLGFVLRPYATLPHPNALAGWLLVAGLMVGGWKQVVSWAGVLMSLSRSAILLVPLVLWRKSKVLTIFLFSIFYFLFSNLGNPTSLSERQVLNQRAIGVITQAPVFGVGLGNFVYAVPTLRQPVHNIYLLLAAELGLPFFGILSFVVIKSLGNLLKIGNWNLKIAVASVLAIGMADHYWLTLHQNILLLVVLLAAGKIVKHGAENKL